MCNNLLRNPQAVSRASLREYSYWGCSWESHRDSAVQAFGADVTPHVLNASHGDTGFLQDLQLRVVISIRRKFGLGPLNKA
jgi:hypothetical protein